MEVGAPPKKATSGTLLTLLTSPGQRYKHQAFIQALLSTAVSPKDTVSLLFAWLMALGCGPTVDNKGKLFQI